MKAMKPPAKKLMKSGITVKPDYTKTSMKKY